MIYKEQVLIYKEQLQQIIFKDYLVRQGIKKDQIINLEDTEYYKDVHVVFMIDYKIDEDACYLDDLEYGIHTFKRRFGEEHSIPRRLELDISEYKKTWIVIA